MSRSPPWSQPPPPPPPLPPSHTPRRPAVTQAVVTRRGSGRGRTEVSGYLLISPAMALLIVFILIPAIWIFWLSFQRWDLISGTSDYIGAANYQRLLLRDDVFRKAVWQTVYFVAGTVPVSMALGLFLAVLLNRPLPLRGFLRTRLFTPHVRPD